MIVALPNSRGHAADLLETWASGDTTRFDAMIDADFKDHAEARDWLISSRNRVWLNPIKNLLDAGGKTSMITVGAAHLGGLDGLIALLCGAGYDVQRVGAPGAQDVGACGPGA